MKLAVVSLLSCSLIIGACVARKFGENSNPSSLPRIESKAQFENYSGSIKCQTGEYIVASSVEEVQAVVKRADSLKQSLRVVSHDVPHSYSTALCPLDGGTILNVGPLNKVLSTNLTGSAPTARIQPGVTIPQLQKQLDPLGFTFPVSPDYNGVTFAGAMGTGAHHSSLRVPAAVADYVEEAVFVNAQGELVTLKGDSLDLARVHLGLLGVLVEMTVRVVPQYKLRFKVERFDDSKLGDEIEAKVRSLDFARVRWFPTQRKAVLDGFEKVPMSTPGDAYDTAWSAVPDLSRLGDVPATILNESKFANCSAEFIRANTYAGSFKDETAKDGINKKPFVGKSHNMIAGTCEKGKCPWETGTRGRTVEVGFPLSQVKNWIADVRAILDVRQACFPANGIYMRFSPASKGALSQAFGEDAVLFEIHIAVGDSPAIEQWSEVYDEIVQMTLAKYNGRPHWAKNSTPYFHGLGEKQFPRFNEFEALRNRMDPNGIFVSSLWKSIADSKMATFKATESRPPNCGVTRQCICSLDSTTDCGPNGRCEQGGSFLEARVCRKK